MNEEATMLEIQPWIKLISNQFCWKYNLDKEELFQEAQLVALLAIRNHDWSKGPLDAWIKKLLWQQFNLLQRSPKFREMYSKKGAEPLDQSRCRFDLHKLLLEVSDDAAKTISLVIQEGVKDRKYIQTLLALSFDWTNYKINKVFQEIQEAIQ